MAKALLKRGKLNCADLEEETDDCAMEVILREIINGQNAQIQTMRAILDSQNYPEEDDCKVEISPSGSDDGKVEIVPSGSDDGDSTSSATKYQG
mmetsp:Transcript_34866/g.76301  ORF Transcript_34866/g.76301 Transcript_34866/m.76301 type:complete len:94 (+) Transcript_34866:1-282(+)